MPLVKYEICNNTASDLKLILEAEIMDFSTPRTDTVEVTSGSTRTFYQLPRLRAEKAKKLTEIRRATVHTHIQYLEGGVTHQYWMQDFEVYLMARNVIRWAVPNTAKEPRYVPLLDHIAAWVTPREDRVKQMLRVAANHIPALSGYPLTYDAEFVREQVKAIYLALQESGLAYINSPFAIGPSEGKELQTVRLPNESLRDHSANCIDGAVLYASLLEQAALEPLIVMLEGHAFVGWKTWPGSDVYEFLETTMTRDATFEEAFNDGMQSYQELKDQGLFNRKIFDSDGFARLLDIKALHDSGIYPIVQ